MKLAGALLTLCLLLAASNAGAQSISVDDGSLSAGINDAIAKTDEARRQDQEELQRQMDARQAASNAVIVECSPTCIIGSCGDIALSVGDVPLNVSKVGLDGSSSQGSLVAGSGTVVGTYSYSCTWGRRGDRKTCSGSFTIPPSVQFAYIHATDSCTDVSVFTN